MKVTCTPIVFFINLTMDPKWLLFQFFSRDIRMHIPILTGVENGRIRLQENCLILLKNVFFKASLPR